MIAGYEDRQQPITPLLCTSPSDLTKRVDQLRALVPPNVRITVAPDDAQPADCHVLVHGTAKAEWLDASPTLRAVIVPYAGVSLEMQQLLQISERRSAQPALQTTSPPPNLRWRSCFATAKFVVPLDRLLRQGDWRQRYGRRRCCSPGGALILGYGAIGRQIALRLPGARHAGARRAPPGAARAVEDGVELFAADQLPALLPETDVLICVPPQTPETVGLIGAAELAAPAERCHRHQRRAGPLSTKRRSTTLHAGHLAGAGIDVGGHLPARRGGARPHAALAFPFHELDNVVMSPHRGGWLEAAGGRRLQELATLITAAANGEDVPNKVDKVLGY